MTRNTHLALLLSAIGFAASVAPNPGLAQEPPAAPAPPTSPPAQSPAPSGEGMSSPSEPQQTPLLPLGHDCERERPAPIS